MRPLAKVRSGVIPSEASEFLGIWDERFLHFAPVEMTLVANYAKGLLR